MHTCTSVISTKILISSRRRKCYVDVSQTMVVSCNRQRLTLAGLLTHFFIIFTFTSCTHFTFSYRYYLFFALYINFFELHGGLEISYTHVSLLFD